MLAAAEELDLLNMALPVALVEPAVVETERVTKTVSQELQILAGAEAVQAAQETLQLLIL
jgi:hypothetical protein